MTKLSATYKRHDVIVIPFPYTDGLAKSKRRPAVIVSDASFAASTGQLICAMITSGKSSVWPNDVKITDPAQAGLDRPCVMRMKLFTLDHRFVLRKAGTLGSADSKALSRSLKAVLRLP